MKRRVLLSRLKNGLLEFPYTQFRRLIRQFNHHIRLAYPWRQGGVLFAKGTAKGTARLQELILICDWLLKLLGILQLKQHLKAYSARGWRVSRYYDAAIYRFLMPRIEINYYNHPSYINLSLTQLSTTTPCKIRKIHTFGAKSTIDHQV